MFVWSKKLIAALLALFLVLLGVFLIHGAPDSASGRRNLRRYASTRMAMGGPRV